MARSNHIIKAEEIVGTWPAWKQRAMKSAVGAHKPAPTAAPAQVILFPLAAVTNKK